MVSFSAFLIVKYTSSVVIFIRGLFVTGVSVSEGAFTSWVLVVVLLPVFVVVVGIASAIVEPLTTAVVVLVSFVYAIGVSLLVPLNFVSHLTALLTSAKLPMRFKSVIPVDSNSPTVNHSLI